MTIQKSAKAGGTAMLPRQMWAAGASGSARDRPCSVVMCASRASVVLYRCGVGLLHRLSSTLREGRSLGIDWCAVVLLVTVRCTEMRARQYATRDRV